MATQKRAGGLMKDPGFRFFVVSMVGIALIWFAFVAVLQMRKPEVIIDDTPASAGPIYGAEVATLPDRYRLTDIRVIDGDTVEGTVALGFDVSLRVRFRLLGIDAPELGTIEGAASKTWLDSRLRGVKVLVSSSGKVDKFGRRLGDLICDGQSITEAMVAAGMAKPYFP